MTENLKVGMRVEVVDKKTAGTIRYFGQTQFQAGRWVGIELDEPVGKNNGTVKGKAYFSCTENHGTFVKPESVRVLSDPMRDSAGSAASGTSRGGGTQSGLRRPGAPPKAGSTSKLPGAGGMKPSASSGRLSARGTPRGSNSALSNASSRDSLKTSPSTDNLSKSSTGAASPAVSRQGSNLTKPPAKKTTGVPTPQTSQGSAIKPPTVRQPSVADKVANLQQADRSKSSVDMSRGAKATAPRPTTPVAREPEETDAMQVPSVEIKITESVDAQKADDVAKETLESEQKDIADPPKDTDVAASGVSQPNENEIVKQTVDVVVEEVETVKKGEAMGDGEAKEVGETTEAVKSDSVAQVQEKAPEPPKPEVAESVVQPQEKASAPAEPPKPAVAESLTAPMKNTLSATKTAGPGSVRREKSSVAKSNLKSEDTAGPGNLRREKSSASRLTSKKEEPPVSLKNEKSNVTKPAPKPKAPAEPAAPVLDSNQNFVTQNTTTVETESAQSAGIIVSPVVPSGGGFRLPDGLEPGAELEYLRVEAKDLSEKLETLRFKRSEDKQKLVDYEKCRIQLEQLIQYKAHIVQEHAELRRELQAAKKEARDAIESKTTHDDSVTDLEESMEIALLDKEMAEERAEMLQQEIESLKDKLEEAQIDLELLRNELQERQKGLPAVATADTSGGDSFDVRQLQAQNDRLKEAIIKMRDLSEHEKSEAQRLGKELESIKGHFAELLRKHEKASAENTVYEQSVQELKEQVDAALGSEQIVEQLTQKNLTLEDRLQTLEETIADLEQMREMDEELQDNARDAEKELQLELNLTHTRVSELRQKLEQAATAIKDYEATIVKFRKHTSQLQEEIQDLKDQVAIATNGGTDDGSRTTDLVDGEGNEIATKINVNTKGGLAAAIESDIRRVDLSNAEQHVRFLRAFLPDNFTKPGGDNDSVLMCLLFPRMIAKIEMLVQYVKNKYPVPPGGMQRDHVLKSHKGDQWSFFYKFSFYMYSLVALFRKIQSVLDLCTVERLSKLAQLQPEMQAQERLIDHYFDLLRQNRIDENTALEQAERVGNFFQNLYTVHLNSESFDETAYADDVSKQLLAGLTWVTMDTQRIRYYLDDDNEFSTGVSSDLTTFLTEMDLYIGEADQACRKIRQLLPNTKTGKDEEQSASLALPDSEKEHLQESCAAIERAAKILHAAARAASNQTILIPVVEQQAAGELSRICSLVSGTDHEGIAAEQMLEFLHDAAEDNMGSDKAMDGKGVNEILNIFRLSLGIVIGHCTKLADAVGRGDYDAQTGEEKQNFPPLLERAHTRKQEAVESEALRWQMEKKDGEIMDLKKALRLKAEEVSEMVVRKDMAEKRLATTGREGDDRVVKLQRNLDEQYQDFKKKEREFEQTMDTLQADIDSLERENGDLKERLKLLSKKALLQGISAQAAKQTSGSSGPVVSPSVESIPSVVMQTSGVSVTQVESIRSALAVVQGEKRRLECEKMSQILCNLKPLNLPAKPHGLTGLVDLDQSTHRQHGGEVNALLRETHKVQKEMMEFVRSHRVVNLDSKQPARRQLLTELQQLYRLHQWTDDVHRRMQRHYAQPFAASVAGAGKQVAPGSDMSRVARLAVSGGGGAVRPVHVDYRQLRQLHDSLAY